MKISSILLLIGLITCDTLSGQINSLWGTKINAITAEPIALHTIEFEPTFGMTRSASVFDQDGLRQNADSIDLQSMVCWRTTFGISRSLEAGIVAPSDFSSLNFAAKLYLADLNENKIALMAGVSLNLGTRKYRQNSEDPLAPDLWQLGYIHHIAIDNDNSIDINIQYQSGLKRTDAQLGSWILFAELGSYSLHERILFIAGFGYQTGPGDAHKFSAYPGVSIELADQFALVLNTQHDLFGRSIESQFGVNLAVTLAFE